MLKVPQLDDITYEQIIQRCINRIPTMTDQWTDFNSHDPGITILQTYAWLTDMLNYYMNATGDVHVEKYLKLLGVEAQTECAAESYVVLEHENVLQIPKGTMFYAGDIPFETMEDQLSRCNSFCSFINEIDGYGMDLTAFAGQDGEFADCFAEEFSDQAVIYLGFEKALISGDRLYICIDEDKNRNAFGKDFRLCDLEWEYYTSKGWAALPVSDETCGLLKCGFVELKQVDDHQSYLYPDGMARAFYIRCVLKDNKYDSLPRMGMVYVNPIKVVQQNTVCQEGEFLQELKIGRTNGCAGQEMEFDYPDAYRFSLALWSLDEKDEAQCEIWNYVEDLEKAGYKDKVFGYDRERRMVRFGDGIHGAVPAQKMPVSVTGLVCSRLDRGNVLAGEIKGYDPELPVSRVYNPAPALGGCVRESVQDMLQRMEETVFAQNRMASRQDYEDRILNTPGLKLELVHVIPGNVYGDLHRQSRGLNEIVAVVKPKSTEKKPVLGSVYKEMIEQYIEPYRLLNTKVSVVTPEYVGIQVHGRISLYHDTPDVRREIQDCLKAAIDYSCKKEPFGSPISYGKLYTRLESLPEVRQVKELELERTGSAAIKNERGDILLQADALSILEKIDLEFCE